MIRWADFGLLESNFGVSLDWGWFVFKDSKYDISNLEAYPFWLICEAVRGFVMGYELVWRFVLGFLSFGDYW